MKPVVVGLSNQKSFAKRIAKRLNAKVLPYTSRKFPDGELLLKFEQGFKGKKVVLVQSQHPNPNDAIFELVLAARTAKKMGAKKVIAVVPYLVYMRQDKVFNFGESFSAKEIGWLLSQCLDELLTFEPHLHRIHSLSKIFSIKAKKLSAAKPIEEFVSKKFNADNTVIVGPDRESSQWAKKIAKAIGFKSTILAKKRLGDKRVFVRIVKELNWKNKNVLIIDDIVSTGTTIVKAIREIKKRKPKAVYCICVHPLLVEGALKKIKKAGAKEVFSCNTIYSKTNKIDLSEEVAKALEE